MQTARTTVPAVTGKTLAEAEALLRRAGLTLGTVTRGSSPQPAGVVIEQMPAAGTRVRAESAVALRRSVGSHDPGVDPGEGVSAPKGSPRGSGAASPVGWLASQWRAPELGPSRLRVPHQIVRPPRDFLSAPPGWQTRLLVDGLENPRWLTVASNGDLFVVESRLEIRRARQPHRVTVVRPDGSRSVWADRLDLPFGIAFHRGFLYVANTGSVVRWPYRDGARTAPGPAETVLSGIPERGIRQHWTRNLLFDPQRARMYLTIGSKENAAIEEPLRATIVAYSLDASGRPHGAPRIVASGMRNPVGLALHPGSKRLWAGVNERDYLGDRLVPDFFTEVHEGGFYGWPYYFLGGHHDPRLPEKPELRRRTVMPDVLLAAHSSPLGVAFSPDGRSAFIARHGSQNRLRRVGYDVIRVPFTRTGRPAGPPEPFVTGWLLDPDDARVYGRPAGLAWARDGSLLVADDWGGRIWRVSRQA